MRVLQHRDSRGFPHHASSLSRASSEALQQADKCPVMVKSNTHRHWLQTKPSTGCTSDRSRPRIKLAVSIMAHLQRVNWYVGSVSSVNM